MFRSWGKWHVFSDRHKGEGRFNMEGPGARFSAEAAWGKRSFMGPGFKLHFGNAGSETPLHFNLYLIRLSFYFSANFPGARRFCEWIGGGHKRDISLSYTEGALWWKLWFDDDGGYDRHHNCDPWRTPKLYPWRWGRNKYRAWMCLRDGHLDLNPLTAFWGARYFSYEDVEKATVVVHVDQFVGDSYPVTFTLQKQTQGRRVGPKWVRHVTDCGYSANWDAAAAHGIPWRIYGSVGSRTYGSSVNIGDSSFNWLNKAIKGLVNRTREERARKSSGRLALELQPRPHHDKVDAAASLIQAYQERKLLLEENK